MPRKSYQSILIAGFLCAVPWAVYFIGADPLAPLAETTLPLPLITLAILAFLSVKLNQTRLFFTAVALAVEYGILWGAPLAPLVQARIVASSAAVATAFSLLGLLFTSGPNVIGASASAAWFFCLMPPACLLVMAYLGMPVLTSMLDWKLAGLQNWNTIPHVSLVILAAFAGYGALVRDRHERHLHRYVSLSFIPLLAALLTQVQEPVTGGDRLIMGLGFTCQSCLLLYAIFTVYWEKVYIDELTGIPNRRALDEHLRKLTGEFTVAMVDIDHFKKFNDTHGHEHGDHVLRFVAAHLARESQGKAYRYGGEEFTLVFPGEGSEAVSEIMDGIRESLAKRTFHLRSQGPRLGKAMRDKVSRRRNKTVKVTISVGVAANALARESATQVIQSADQALYEAKGKGRNCVVLALEESAA